MKLLFKQRLFAWLDSYDIFDENQNTVFTVKGVLAFKHSFKVKFGSPVTLEYEAEGLTGEYMLGADTDLDLQTACCVTAVAAAAEGKLIFTPPMDSQTFYDKVQRDGKTAGFWEIPPHVPLETGKSLFLYNQPNQ